MRKRIAVLTIVIFTVLEIVLRSSHIYPLYNLELIYILGTIFILAGLTKLALYFVLVASILVEFIFTKTTGISGLAFFAAALLMHIVFRFNSLISSERYILRLLLTLLLAVIFKSVLLNLVGNSTTSLQFPDVLSNLLVYLLVVLIYERFSVPQNVLKS